MYRTLCALFVLALLATACGGGSSNTVLAPSPAAVATQTSPATPSLPPPGAPTATPAVAPLDAAIQAAVKLIDGFRTTDAAACKAQTKGCIMHGTDADSPDKGIAVLALTDPTGGGAKFVMGQKAAGDWGFWFGTQQQTYHALALPAQMRVCADGQGVNVRQAADEASTALGLLKDGTMVTVEKFVLTQAATYKAPGPLGNGWYSVSGALPGFVRADFLSVATLPDCELRSALTK